MNTVFLGTEMKLNVSIEPIDSLTMDGYDFVVDIYTSPSKSLSIKKSQAKRLDENNYLVLVDTKALGTGNVRCRVTAYIPDADFDDNVRTEIVVMDTGINIAKSV